jgi:DEAD/DEAH box helicase domain-containing protein
MAALCPGLIRLHSVTEEASVGDPLTAGQRSTAQESDIAVELKLPRAGASVRDFVMTPYQNKGKEVLRVVSGSVGYGEEVYSAIAEMASPAADRGSELLPALVQGCRAAPGKVSRRGLSQMAVAAARWLTSFRGGLVEAVEIEHDAFLRSRGLQWDAEAEGAWHPEFRPDTVQAEAAVSLARKEESWKPTFRCIRPKSSAKKAPKFTPCRDVSRMGPTEFLEHLKGPQGLGGSCRAGGEGSGSSPIVVYERTIPARQAEYCTGGMRGFVEEEVIKSLGSVGIHNMYSHQAEAIRLLKQESRNVCVCTSTASGKSICYNVPALEILLSSQVGSVLLVMPTKALAQDQARATKQLLRGLPGGAAGLADSVGVYDGDTPHEERDRLRNEGRLLITNPDMLHCTLLPHWSGFRRFWSGLGLVVLDEAHSYTGVFGGHVSFVLRRLRRLCEREFGVQPKFVVSSATISNADEHAAQLTGMGRESWTVVHRDGSPRGEKTFVLWNPPAKQGSALRRLKRGGAEGGGLEEAPHVGRRQEPGAFHLRTSPIMEISLLLAEAVQHGLRTLAFCKTRKMVELVLQYTREILSEVDIGLADSLAAYRAGYTAVERRGIEGSLFSGKLLGVCATNALELGIDVGALDVTLHLGFPGRLSSLWQQAGRAGRRSQGAISIMVGFDGPLDQYFFSHPEKLFDAAPECTAVDPHNLQVLEQHAPCAAYELPLLPQRLLPGRSSSLSDVEYFGGTLQQAAERGLLSGALGRNPANPALAGLEYIGGVSGGPAKTVSLRAISDETFQVVLGEGGPVVEEIEASKAFYQIYEGAIYMNQGVKYLCVKLDLEERVCTVRKVSVGYFTSLIHFKDVEVTGGNPVYPLSSARGGGQSAGAAQIAAAQFVMRVERFDKISLRTRRVFDKCPLRLPDTRYETVATWVRVPGETLKLKIHLAGKDFREGLHAAGHALLNALPMHIICDPQDVGCLCYSDVEKRYRPSRLLLYDQQPGGTGISQQVYPIWESLLRSALRLVEACPCSERTGCPKCTQHAACPQHNQALDKGAAAMVLEGVLSQLAGRGSDAVGPAGHPPPPPGGPGARLP